MTTKTGLIPIGKLAPRTFNFKDVTNIKIDNPRVLKAPQLFGEKPLLKRPSSRSLIPQIAQKVDDVEEQIEDIDKSTSPDAIFYVSDIAKDIYGYMYDLEEAQSIKENHLETQKIVTPKVRQRLINWCIEISTQLKLLAETEYITVALIDRYFDRVQVKQQSQVQLIAVSAMLIASKYEEIYPPDISDLIHLTQNAYSRKDIIKMEMDILEKLEFELGRPIPLAFLRRFSKAAQCDLKMHSIAKYLMELSLTEYQCSHWKPSFLAAACLYTTIYLVRRSLPLVCGSRRWSKTMVHYTRYTKEDLEGAAGTLCKILKRAQKSPRSYYCVHKNLQNLSNWPELKSTRVDELTKLAPDS